VVAQVSVEAALRTEIEALPADLQRSSLAATALALAAQMDSPRNGGTSKAMIAKEYRETLRELRAAAPAKVEDNELDRVRRRRAGRMEGRSAPETASSS
jgi:hypothetical protein